MTSSSRQVPDDQHFDERHVMLYLGLLMDQARELIAGQEDARTRCGRRSSG